MKIITLPHLFCLAALLAIINLPAAQAKNNAFTLRAAQVLYVSPSGDDANDGSSLGSAKRTIQAGIDAAQSGYGVVIVADGTYTGQGNVDLDYGGKSITVTSQHGAYATIIDCQGSSNSPHRAFYFHSGEPSTSAVYGITIRDGYTSDNGGGMLISGSSPTIANCILSGNSAAEGGGIALSSGNPIFTNCIFSGNSATYGGGMFLSSSATLTNCTFTSNLSSYIAGAIVAGSSARISNCILWGDRTQYSNTEISGGGSSPLNVTYSDIQGGYSGTGNITLDPLFVNATIGDLHLQTGSPCLGKGTSTGAPANDLDGRTRPNPPSIGAYELGNTLNVPSQYPTIQAGIDAALPSDTVLVADGTYTGDGNRDLDFLGKSLTVQSVNGAAKTIIDCQGTSRGFYIHSNELSVKIKGFTVEHGTTAYDGGGVSIDFVTSTTIMACTFKDNTAISGDGYGGFGGGVSIGTPDGTVTVENCTFSDNTSSGGGGAASIVVDNGTATVENCTFSDNTVSEGGSGSAALIYATGNASITNCIDWDIKIGGDGSEFAFGNPASAAVTFCDIQGGYAGTGNIDSDPLFVNVAAGDLHLQPGSPCLGTGNPNGAPATDLDGNPRPNPPSIGAYELAPTPATITAFMLSPNQINAAGSTVTADVTAQGTFSKVTVSPAPGTLGTASPTFTLTGNGTDWTGPVPTAYLKLAKTNPVTFIATGTRADGTVATAVTTLVIGTQPTLKLSLSPPSGTNVAKRQIIPFTVNVSNPAQTLATLTTVTITLPDHVTFVSSPDFAFDGNKTLTWQHPLGAASSLGSNLAILSFTVTVTSGTVSNTNLLFHGTASAPNFQPVTQDDTLVVDSALVPQGVTVDASGGFGLLDGTADVDLSQGNTPLHATLTPVTETSNVIGLFGSSRPLSIWLDLSVGKTVGADWQPAGGRAAQYLATNYLMAPSVSPSYAATFTTIDDAITVSAQFDGRAAGLTLFDLLITAIITQYNIDNPGKSIPLFTADDVVRVANDLTQLSGVLTAAKEFSPLPKNTLQLLQAVARASKDLILMSDAEKTALKLAIEAVIGDEDGAAFATAFDSTIGNADIQRVLAVTGGVSNLLHVTSDLLTLDILAKGQPMVVSFDATPLTNQAGPNAKVPNMKGTNLIETQFASISQRIRPTVSLHTHSTRPQPVLLR